MSWLDRFFTSSSILVSTIAPGADNSVLTTVEGAAAWQLPDIVFDGGTTSSNVRSNRDEAVQSPIDNTQDGIVNFGSQESSSVGATNSYATICGGLNNEASGLLSAVCGGSYNKSQATTSFIGAGDHNEATAAGSVVTGGSVNVAQSGYSTIAGGYHCTISAAATYGSICGGAYCVVIRPGQHGHAGDRFSVDGDAQWSRYSQLGVSVNAAATQLRDSASIFAPAPAGDFLLENGKSYFIKATCDALDIGNGDVVTLEYKLQVKKSSAGTATIINTIAGPDNTTLLNGKTWSLAFSISTGALRATFTGAAGRTVRALIIYEFIEVGGWV